MLAYSSPFKDSSLYYWHREERTSKAEVDYLFQKNELIPLEIKSGDSGAALQSIKLFLDTHPNSPYGIRVSPENFAAGKIRTRVEL